jgi:hypothetical protein
VLKEGLSDEVVEAFRIAYTNAVCGAPGLTHHLQECDTADTFRDFKTGLDTVTKRNIDVRDPTLEAELIRVLNAEFKIDFPTVDISPDLKVKILFALQKCVYVMREKYVTPKKIKEGFIRVGTHRIVDKDDNLIGEGDCTVDYSRYWLFWLSKGYSDHMCMNIRMMNQVRPTTTEDDRAMLEEKFELVVAEAIKEARVSDAFLDGLELPNDGTKNRDDLNISNCDAFCFTHVASKERQDRRTELERQRLDPGTVQLNKRIADAKKVVKRKATANQKARDREEENERKKALSPDERKEEAEAKRALAAANKRARIDKDAQDLEEAKDLLGDESFMEEMGHNFADDGLLDIPHGLFGGNLVHVDLGDFAVDEEEEAEVEDVMEDV